MHQTLLAGTVIQINGNKKNPQVQSRAHLVSYRLAKNTVLVNGQMLESSRARGEVVEAPNGWRYENINHSVNLEYDKIILPSNTEAVKMLKLDKEY